VVLLVGGLWLVNDDLGVTPATAAPPVKDNPHLGVTQNGDKNLPRPSRFTVLTDFGGAAVRDENTKLVWEQAPDAIPRNWVGAISYCANKTVKGTDGWRLPSMAELLSVRKTGPDPWLDPDPSSPWLDPDPSLPAPFGPGGVFASVKFGAYWSASTVKGNPAYTGFMAQVMAQAWVVELSEGHVDYARKSFSFNVWCVRGDMNADAY
jgi:hypothetical protein